MACTDSQEAIAPCAKEPRWASVIPPQWRKDSGPPATELRGRNVGQPSWASEFQVVTTFDDRRANEVHVILCVFSAFDAQRGRQ